jgi:hypothetical protein
MRQILQQTAQDFEVVNFGHRELRMLTSHGTFLTCQMQAGYSTGVHVGISVYIDVHFG